MIVLYVRCSFVNYLGNSAFLYVMQGIEKKQFY